jgi:hypothetical protein
VCWVAERGVLAAGGSGGREDAEVGTTACSFHET